MGSIFPSPCFDFYMGPERELSPQICTVGALLTLYHLSTNYIFKETDITKAEMQTQQTKSVSRSINHLTLFLRSGSRWPVSPPGFSADKEPAPSLRHSWPPLICSSQIFASIPFQQEGRTRERLPCLQVPGTLSKGASKWLVLGICSDFICLRQGLMTI